MKIKFIEDQIEQQLLSFFEENNFLEFFKNEGENSVQSNNQWSHWHFSVYVPKKWRGKIRT